MEAAVLLYPGCIFFEIALAAETLASCMRLRYFTPDGLVHQASNGAVIESAGDLSDLQFADVRAILIPGGDPTYLLSAESKSGSALRRQAGNGAVVAGICAGNLVMAASGLLRGRRGTHNYTPEHASPEKVAATSRYWQGMDFVRADLVEDGNLITAQPWAYRKYAATLGRVLGVITDSESQAMEQYVARRSYVRY